MTQKKRPQRHGLDAPTILILMVGILLFFGIRTFIASDGPHAFGNSGGYDDYAGPILPLTCVSSGEGITAQRHVDFDFSTYDETYVRRNSDPSEVLVTDTYALTNPTAEDKRLTLAYPYEHRWVEEGFFPTIAVSGQKIQPEMYFSLDSEKNIQRAKSFATYKERMTEKDYLASALENPVVADIPVKAYHFTDITYNGDRRGTIPFLTMTFTIPKGTKVWTRHYDVSKSEDEKDTYSLWFRDTLDEQDAVWLFVADGDIENITFGGNLGYNEKKDSVLTDVTYEYEIVETTFADLMWKFSQEYDFWADQDFYPKSDCITPEILYRDTMKRIGGDMGKGYNPMFGQPIQCVTDKFFDTFVSTRLQYMIFPITIPAGETVSVEATYWKEASYNFIGETSSDGYEIATQLGSSLTFTELTASIQNIQWIEIEKQDLGFAPQNGITETKLDLEKEQYRLVIHYKNL